MGVVAGVGNDDVAAAGFSFGPAGGKVGYSPEADDIVVAAVGEEERVGDVIAGFVPAGVHESGPEAEAVVAGDDPADESGKGLGAGFQAGGGRGEFSDDRVRAMAKEPGNEAVAEFEKVGFFSGQAEGTNAGEGKDSLGIMEDKFLADQAAHGMADEDNFFAVEMVEDGRKIAGGESEGKLIAVRPGLPVAANIPDKDAEVPGEKGDLMFEDSMIHHDAVSKNDQRPIGRPGQPEMKRAVLVFKNMKFHIRRYCSRFKDNIQWSAPIH